MGQGSFLTFQSSLFLVLPLLPERSAQASYLPQGVCCAE